jgi:effector-binding domain-containing protein
MNPSTMRKYSAIFILLALLFGANFFPYTITRSVSVPYTSAKVMEQVNNTDNLQKWTYPFLREYSEPVETATNYIAQEKDTLFLVRKDVNETELALSNSSRKQKFHVAATPQTTDTANTLVTLKIKTTLADQYWSKRELINDITSSIEEFGKYMNSIPRLYGYDIKEEKVTTPFFLYTTQTVPAKNFQEGMQVMYEKLIQEADTRNAGYNGTRIFHVEERGDSSIQLFAGIGISHEVKSLPNDPVQFQLIPIGKNLLVADYEGPYGEVKKIYHALETYIADHHLVSKAMPFHQFLSEGTAFTDQQIVRIKVACPLY